MKNYEDYLKEYVKRNKSVLNENASRSKTLIKFSEAVARAILENKKSDASYGDTAEALAAAGLSSSGFGDYIKSKANVSFEKELALAENEKNLNEATSDELYRNEMARLEEERIKKEAKAQELREKIKKSVASYAISKNITDYTSLYEYAVAMGLDEKSAEEIAKTSIAKVLEGERQKNIEKSRSVIISQKLTNTQAYAYAKSLGLSEADAVALAEFAYEINQNPGYVEDKTESSGTASPTPKPNSKPDKNFNETQLYF